MRILVNDWFADIEVVITNNRKNFDLNVVNKNCKISKPFVLLLPLQLSFNTSNENDNQKNDKNNKNAIK